MRRNESKALRGAIEYQPGRKRWSKPRLKDARYRCLK